MFASQCRECSGGLHVAAKSVVAPSSTQVGRILCVRLTFFLCAIFHLVRLSNLLLSVVFKSSDRPPLLPELRTLSREAWTPGLLACYTLWVCFKTMRSSKLPMQHLTMLKGLFSYHDVYLEEELGPRV